MGMRDAFLHTDGERIERAQAHGACKVLDGPIRLAEPHFDKAAGNPPKRSVWINQQSLVNKGGAIIELASDIGERVSSITEYGSVVLSQLHSASGQPSSFGNFLLSVEDPAKSLAHAKTHSGCGIRCREISIKFNSFVKQAEGFLIALPGPFVSIGPSAQKQVVGIKALGWFAPGTFDFCLSEPRRDCAHHTCRNLVLQREDILNCTFDAIRPKMCTR